MEEFSKESLSQKNFENIAQVIVKYQKFRPSIAVEKMRTVNMTTQTKLNYFNFGRKYLKENIKIKNMPSKLYAEIDKLKAQCIQPLTPSLEDESRKYKRNYTKKEAIPPVAKLEIVNNSVATSNIEYGVKSGSNIMLMPNREYALGFLAGLKNLNSNKEIDAKVITVEMGNITE